VAKHRQGATGVVSAYFKKEQAQFVDLQMKTERLDY